MKSWGPSVLTCDMGIITPTTLFSGQDKQGPCALMLPKLSGLDGDLVCAPQASSHYWAFAEAVSCA